MYDMLKFFVFIAVSWLIANYSRGGGIGTRLYVPQCRSGEIGRHAGFKNPWGQPLVGSSPTCGTLMAGQKPECAKHRVGSIPTRGTLMTGQKPECLQHCAGSISTRVIQL